MWSVGVVILELILGSPHVFQISDRTRALLDKHLEGWSEHTMELAYKYSFYLYWIKFAILYYFITGIMLY